ncbi:hypothetical protein OZX67_02140 [Bifidobacterium sp. ESL0728]|uniref:hypothetical protein n=1 Tax=Bifidobacterium sp. ESL0728 TaxID=2983220 RepID=UPI0023F6D4C8|nr:hypothetical protein [Bifidobacterium sp. ESL0728]WEV59385.1 hypothetical protein OZX67_02140 [Bifidobacterium sp. ESL0728]
MKTRIGITGHQRIPAAAYGYVERGLSEFLRSYEGLGKEVTGVSCLAYGADQLFASAMLKGGHGLEAIIPCDHYETTFDDAGLREYRSLLGRASNVLKLDYPQPCEDAFLAAGLQVVDRCDVLVAFWDGLPAAGKGGTGDVVDYARQQGKPVTIIWPEGVVH